MCLFQNSACHRHVLCARIPRLRIPSSCHNIGGDDNNNYDENIIKSFVVVVVPLLYSEVQSTIASKFKFINCTNFGCHPDNRHDAWRTHSHTPAHRHITQLNSRAEKKRKRAGWTGIMKNSVTKENKLISLFKWIIKHWITSHLCGVLNTYNVPYFLSDFSTRTSNLERRTTMLIVIRTAFVRLLHDKWQWLSFIHLPRATHARRRITCRHCTHKNHLERACVRLCVCFSR